MKPEALRLADALEAYWAGANGHDRERQAAAELRRLHTDREALLKALKAMLEQFNFNTITGIVHDESAAIVGARAAIAVVEGEQT